VWVHFWRATSDVKRSDTALRDEPQALVYCLTTHHFAPTGTRIDVAMSASLIAKLPDIDLEDLNTSRTQRNTAIWRKHIGKCLRTPYRRKRCPLRCRITKRTSLLE
jgi:hypothetical protein